VPRRCGEFLLLQTILTSASLPPPVVNDPIISERAAPPGHLTCSSTKGVNTCSFRCLQMSMSNVDTVPCKCRWKCRKYIDLWRGKSPQTPQLYVEKMQNRMLIYIYIYMNTHTHTRPQKSSFFEHFHDKKCKKNRDWLKKMSMSIERTCKCRTYVDVDGSRQMSTWYGRLLYTPSLTSTDPPRPQPPRLRLLTGKGHITVTLDYRGCNKATSVCEVGWWQH